MMMADGTRSLIVSQKARYALRALLMLAETQVPLRVGQVAEAQAIPQRFLEKIFGELKRAGIVSSLRGRTGGYLLARSAASVSFTEILTAVDGEAAPLPCLRLGANPHCADCLAIDPCPIRKAYAEVTAAIDPILRNTTLADATNSRNTLGTYSPRHHRTGAFYRAPE